MLGEILDYEIKATDFVMLMCCYSKLGLDVLLMSRAQAPACTQTRHRSSSSIQINNNKQLLVVENTAGALLHI